MTGAEHHTHAHHHHDDVDWAEHAAASELEAEVLIAILEASVALVADQAGTDGIDVRRVIDIGPGPGVGTSVLAERFADAEVIAVDGSDAMLTRVDDRAARLGFAHRLSTVHADLPAGLVGLERADVLWASMVLHHVGDERAMLALIHSALALGGVLAIVEFGDPMRFLPEATGTEPPGFQGRLAAAGAAWVAQMREALPDAAVSADYPTMLRDAGFELVTDTLVATHLDPPLSTDARTVVANHLRRRRDGDGSTLEPADAAALDALLDADDPNGIMHRPDVFLDGSRHLYIARAINPGGRTDA
jgi:ubiquinone/menaquinone biosynthesis C-methylase UbiE